MNPPTSTSAASALPPPPRPNAVPSFRSFVSVELPFTLAPTITRTSIVDVTDWSTSFSSRNTNLKGAVSCPLAPEDRSEVEAFLPPSFVVECVQHDTPQRTRVRSGNTDAKRDGRAEGLHSQSTDDVDAMPDESSDDDSQSGCSNSSSSNGSGDDNSTSGSGSAGATAAAAMKGRTQKSDEVRLLTRHRRDYCTDPIFSDWRSTDWGAASDATFSELDESHRYENESPGGSVAADLRRQKRRRLEVFPSIVPQVLVNGYYRNDVLVQVRRVRLVRRYCDPVTNAVLREETIDTEDDAGANTKEASLCAPAEASASAASAGGSGRGNSDVGKSSTVAEVLGVVSRELELARPADFTFALFTPEQLHASSSLCGADFFPPAHYLSAKAPFEVRYEPGKEVNTAVADLNDQRDRLADGSRTNNPPAAAVPSQFELDGLPMISVGVEETSTLPARLPAHDDYLRSLSSSLDGSRDDDPLEVQMVVRLLAERPAWIVHDLADAMLQSGLCPRTHRNKQVMNCFTYAIRSGPFNRLRLRLGYDPYANSRSAPYQRIAVRLHRRSDLGVRLRDISRSPLTEKVLRLLLERDRARRVAYKAAPGHEQRSTLLELQCRMIRDGRLVLPYQLIDSMDDTVVADIVRGVVAADAPMEPRRRSQRRGWLSEAAYTRVLTYFIDSLAQLLEREVEPLLRKFKGDEEDAVAATAAATVTGRGGRKATTRGPIASADDEEESDDDSVSSLSAMSSATADGDDDGDGDDDDLSSDDGEEGDEGQ